MALGLSQPLTEMSTRNISLGQRWPVRRADNLTTFMCRLSVNLGISAYRNPLGLSTPLMGLLYLYLKSGLWDIYPSTDNSIRHYFNSTKQNLFGEDRVGVLASPKLLEGF